MKLGTKIYKLRKEKGLSQEALAELLGTTRQAISKWENDQGFPETEKLLQLANIFEVSTDFLLKEEKTDTLTDDKGYYVSREMAASYIANEKRTSKYIGLGFSFFALAGIPYIVFDADSVWRMLGMAACITFGIIAVVIAMFTSRDEYKVLKNETLLFDYGYLKELTNEYRGLKKKYIGIAAPCTVLFIVGLLGLAVTVRYDFPWTNYHALIFLAFSVGVFGFVFAVGAMEAYEVLINNDSYSKRLLFKIKKKMREKVDKL